MLAVEGYLRFKPEDRDEVVAGLIDVMERSRKDAGCVAYWWAEAVDEPNTFRFFECWESPEQFAAHRDAPYEHEFMERIASRMTGADASQYEISSRGSAMGT